MALITIASSKGGPGRTTLAELLAGSLAIEGRNVAALDADPTGGLKRWATRLYEVPAFTHHHEADEARLANLIHRVAKEADVVIADTAGFGNRAATVAMTTADAMLIPMVPGEGDVTEAAPTVELVAGVAAAARRAIPCRVLLNRVRSSTALSKHTLAEASALPKLKSSLSDLVAYGEMGFPAGCREARLVSRLPLSWLSCASWVGCRVLVARRQMERRQASRQMTFLQKRQDIEKPQKHTAWSGCFSGRDVAHRWNSRA